METVSRFCARTAAAAERSPQDAHGDFGQITEAGGVGRHDRASAGASGGGDEEVVSAAGPAFSARVGEQGGVSLGDLEVVGLDRNAREQRVDKPATSGRLPPVGELDANKKLGGRYRGDRHVILIAHHLIDR